MKVKNLKYYIRYFVSLIIFCILTNTSEAQFYNGSQLTFGKNRVQYSNNFWTFYRFKKFDTYFYLGGKSLAIFTAKYADAVIPEMEKKLDYNLENKMQFVIFNKLGDLKESNIGLVTDEQYNIGGITHIVGNKVFIYYDGSHENFKRQIRAGIAQVLINGLINGQQLLAKVKNSTLLTLPDWYMNGLVSYLSESWNVETDNYVRDGILSGRYEKFNRLTGTDATYAGHSIWKYIADKYGQDKIANILYMTKISKSVESGFLYVLGISFKTFAKEWLSYYNKKYFQFDEPLNMPEGESFFKNKNPRKVIQQFKLSPNGDYAAFVTNEIGKSKVWLYNFKKKKFKMLFKQGYKLDEKTDYSFPLLAWHPTGKRLAIITESKGKIFLRYYNTEEKSFEKIRIFDFQKILDFSYSQNGKLLAMSAVREGQTDLFVYNLGAHTYEQITKDIYDDLNPVFINNSKQIIFSSNRTNDTIMPTTKDSIIIPNSKLDLFLYDYSGKNKILRRITNTPNVDETNPLLISDNYISYLSDQNGIVNRFTAKIDSTINFVDTTTHYRYFTTSYAQTNYPRNIISYDVCSKTNQCGEVIYNKGLYKIYSVKLTPVDSLSTLELYNSPYMNEYLRSKEVKQSKNVVVNPSTTNSKTTTSTNTNVSNADKNQQVVVIPPDTNKVKHKRLTSVHAADTVGQKNKVDINNFTFSNVETPKKGKSKQDSIAALKKDTTKIKLASKPQFVLPKQQNYDVEYSIDKTAAQVDFGFLNNTYQPFTNDGSPIYINPGFNLLFKVGVTDLLEDYRITGGVNLSINFDNIAYVLSYENLKRRLDKQFLFNRQTLQDEGSNSVTKTTSNELFYILTWPFNQVLALKGTALVRNDRIAYLSTDQTNLETPNEYLYWGGAKGELTFDNTRDKGLNLYYGTRWKLFVESYKQIGVSNKEMYVTGLDFRHYTKISRTFIWANRIAASTSFGTQKLVYYMGGEDNWLIPKFNNNINVATDNNYAYQTIATPMRGFIQNVRNGNSFALINSELRFPVFHYLMNRPLKSQFFDNFQVIGFGDIGSAWTGNNPWKDKNALYTSTVEQGPITVTVKNQLQPIVGGYGFGLRTKILGYFIRADWAWGVDDWVIQKDVFYLSLGLDF